MRLVICLVLSSLFVPCIVAQEVDKKENLLSEKLKSIDKEGRPSKKSWRGNRQDFFIDKGELSLFTKNAFGRRLLVTDVKFGQTVTWSGTVKMDALPTDKNYAYILLTDLPQYSEEKEGLSSYEYLALSIGGQGSKRITLVTLRFKFNSDKIETSKLALDSDIDLTEPIELPIKEPLKFNYRVTYDYKQGKLSFSLDYPDAVKHRKIEETIDWQEILPQEEGHSFGFLINYSKNYQNAFHFSNMCIKNGYLGDKSNSSDDKPTNQDDNKLKDEDKPVLISEVMPKPKANSVEYIELYNLNDKVLDLSDYQIGVGSSEDKIHKVSLRTAGFIEAKSYLVLSINPKTLLESYPSCPKDLAVQVNLPRMNDKGCYVFLYKNGQLIDGLHYNPKDLPKGFQSKKGIALQRSLMEHKELMTDIRWHIGRKEEDFATAGLPNSPAPSGTDLPKDGKRNDKNSNNKDNKELTLVDLQSRLKADNSLVVEVRIYDLMGALLYHLKSSEARAYITSFYTKDRAMLHDRLPNQWLISQIILTDPKGKSPREVLTSIFFPY